MHTHVHVCTYTRTHPHTHTHGGRLQIHLSALNTDADGSLSFDDLLLLFEVSHMLLIATDFLLATGL